MRMYRIKNKHTCLLAALTIGVLIFYCKRRSIEKFYDNFTASVGDYSDGLSRTSWPPRLRIVKKKFGSSSSNSSISFSSSTKDAPNLKQSHAPASKQSCRFPKLRVDDPELKHLFHDVEPLKCAEEKNWVYVRNGTFYIDEEAVKLHSGNGDGGSGTAITCDYTNFWRESEFYTASKTETNFRNGMKLRGDFFKVKCSSSKDGATYSNVHAGIVPTSGVIERCRSRRLPETALGLNVYMLGFDSVSRMTLMRKLPKTYKYLTETMNAIVLKGYNIVGDGTPQALIPILTGKTELELPLTRKRFRNAQFVNVYPFVWNDFRDAGYATLYGEDAAYMGTFTLRLKGFDAQPTDHYMRTFYTVAEKEARKHPKYCWGSEPQHKVHFRYVEHMWESYPLDIRKFAFQFHSVLSHEDINKVGLVDDDVVEHLRLFVERGYMNDTILIVMSDHGHRFDRLRETQQGKLEERLPFFAFAFPPWFAKLYPATTKAFQMNAERLTTPFDIHATLKSILDFRSEPRVANLKNRELSLFDFIPPQRTCSHAGIEAHWCACLEWTMGSTDDPLVQYAAKSLVHAINLETERERSSCAVLQLHSVTKAAKYSPSAALLRYKTARDRDGFVPDLTDDTPLDVIYYQIYFRTTPGDARYEASVTYDKRANEMIVDLDTVSHVNKYGDLPGCIIDRDYFLMKWCVCLDKIKGNELQASVNSESRRDNYL